MQAGTAGTCGARPNHQGRRLYEETRQAAEAGDAAKTAQAFEDLKQRYPGTGSGAAGARCWRPKGSARPRPVERAGPSSTGWPTALSRPSTGRSPACGWPTCCWPTRAFDDALKQLDAPAPTFAGLVADRRGRCAAGPKASETRQGCRVGLQSAGCQGRLSPACRRPSSPHWVRPPPYRPPLGTAP